MVTVLVFHGMLVAMHDGRPGRVMSLHVQESGPAEAPTIVFLHGGGGAGWMWGPQVDRLADYHCLVPDLPEHGRSVEVKPFSISGTAELIAELIRTRAHGGRAHVVGLSEGAQVTVALMAIADDLVDHAIVSSALVRPIRGAGMVGPGLIRWTFRLSVAPFRHVDWWTRLNMKHAAGVPDEYYPQFRQTFQELTESGFTNLMIENQRFRLPRGLDRVTAPTLIVVGRHEYRSMRDSASDLAAALPGSLAREVVHARRMSVAQEHNWNLTAPDLFTSVVRAWITDRALPAELQPTGQSPGGDGPTLARSGNLKLGGAMDVRRLVFPSRFCQHFATDPKKESRGGGSGSHA